VFRTLAARGGWIRTFARVDLRSVRMERLLLLVATAPVGLALAIRFGYDPLSGYLRHRFGVDLSPYTGVVLDLLVIVHVPIIMGMIGSLLVLDDIDERRLLLFRVTPVTLERYLAYRIVSVGLLALAGLLIAIPLSGLDTAPLLALLPAAVLAAALGPLMMLGVTAFAANKVQGIAALKVLGGLVMGLAALPWWLPESARWALLVLPPDAVTYAQRSAEAGDWLGVVLALCVGLTATVAVGAALAARTVHRLTR
jgi:fluoroquinolone transport system permease protein